MNEKIIRDNDGIKCFMCGNDSDPLSEIGEDENPNTGQVTKFYICQRCEMEQKRK